MDEKLYNNVIKNRAEMLSYNLIATASSMQCVGRICEIKWDEYRSEEDRALIREALHIQLIIKNMNYIEFFRILRRPTTNYFFACLMLLFINKMRQQAIEVLYNCYRFTGFPLSLVKAKLNLPSEDDADSLIRACGFIKTEPGSKQLM